MIEPRPIGRTAAAAYCGITPTAFCLWVSQHIMPPAIPGTRKWDKVAIDKRFDELSGVRVPETEVTVGRRPDSQSGV